MQCPLCMQEGLEHRVDPTIGGVVTDRGNYMMVCSACSEVQILDAEAVHKAQQRPIQRRLNTVFNVISATFSVLIDIPIYMRLSQQATALDYVAGPVIAFIIIRLVLIPTSRLMGGRLGRSLVRDVLITMVSAAIIVVVLMLTIMRIYTSV